MQFKCLDKINPNEFLISYTIDPATGKAVTLNNRGLAALVEGGKFPDNVIFVPYDKVPSHFVADIKNRPPSTTIGNRLENDEERLYHPDSGFYEVIDSKHLQENIKRYDPRNRLNLKHYIVKGYDSYIELIASTYSVNELN
ncbi:hypothetical protein [Aneurinibacillus migulanus]|uniref:hypothetical protein n=1 Tax=Aneurinibacillus migulanus TaxID=47500 RepID=UPI0006B57E50|nr:hypothetical protein [Aneurinibacillus migulanus]MCP1359037.1 hypothetical protein [Aneurinibacillus migulanus]